jgi:hypothetical protein
LNPAPPSKCHKNEGESDAIFGSIAEVKSMYFPLTIILLSGSKKGFIKGVKYTISIGVVFLLRRFPSSTTLVLKSRVVYQIDEPWFYSERRHGPTIIPSHAFLA